MTGAIGIYAYTRFVGDTFGGVEAHVGHIASFLAASGYRVVVHCLSAPNAGWHIAAKEFSIGRRLAEKRSDLWEFIPAHGPGVEGCIRENEEVTKQFDERLILSFGTRDGFASGIALRVASKLGLRLVSFVYYTGEERWFRSQFTSRTRSIAGIASSEEKNALDAQGRAILNDVIVKSDLIVVPTHYVRGQLSNTLPPPDMVKVVVCYHGVDTGLFRLSAGKEWWQYNEKWVHVSRISTPFACFKNFVWSCELVRLAVERGSSPRLSVYGDGNGRCLIEEFAEANALSEHIRVAGFVEQGELREGYREACVLLVPSMMEAGCTVVVEAVLCGCLPLVLDHAGAAEVMDLLGLTDYLLPSKCRSFAEGVETVEPDAERALDLLTEVRAAPETAKRRMEEAQRLARSSLSLDVTGARLLQRLRERGLL
jgi:glycosyltransferase involved in cell wall biosynthesis